jgi:hypothetical protein
MARKLLRQMGSVAADVPRFATAPLYRSWHLRWGATDAEVAAAMPGDDVLPRAQFHPTRAITMAAPPAAVWPWLVQVGFGPMLLGIKKRAEHVGVGHGQD